MLYANVVHRMDAAPESRKALEFQWKEARRLGLRTTTLLTYPVLFDEQALDEARALCGAGDELGIHLHETGCPRLLERHGISEPMLWLWPREARMRVIGEMVERFTEAFGAAPRSIGAYLMDAWTLREIERRHPGVRTAITSCFEEGVKMYYGNNRNWLLFSDGGPWNPYFPSRNNALAPARSKGEGIDIVALPHLNRDMIQALSSRDDWFASHPGNVMRARLNEGPECPYLFRFLREWERQAELNGWSYLNIFVSSPWLLGGHWCVEREEDVRSLYVRTLEHLRAREEAGVLRTVTMDAFGAAFREREAAGGATLCHWRDVLRESRREVVWLSNAHHRSAFDMARGGALVDFRPYGPSLNLDLGPESERLWNGNVPFLVSTEHTGGHWRTSQHAILRRKGHSAGLCDRRLRVDVERIGAHGWLVRSRPARYEVGGGSAMIASEWELSAASGWIVRRRLVDCDFDPSELSLAEVFLGRWGVNEYPEDQRDIVLRAGGAELPLAYTGAERVVEGGAWAEAAVPRSGVSLRLSALVPALRARLADGLLFSPAFRLELEFALVQPAETRLETIPL